MIAIGQSVGNYNITAVLGAGGMGTVFLAEHPVIGSKVALKAIHPQFARNAEVFARFVNEAKAVNQIGHDHIIDITDFGKAPSGDFYFMMEYLQGDTLAAAIKRGPLPPARALGIAAQIADALGASHQYGIIHRDLKPENIFLIVRDGVEDFVKVLDFGLAKLTYAEESATYQSGLGALMGTPYYMSPEQCEGRSEIDQRADIYSLGVILFEMLTGLIPFGGRGYGEILVKHITIAPPSARSLIPDLPKAVDVLLLRSLAKAPELRFQTMSNFREAMLDPEQHASLHPLPSGLDDDLTKRVRVAMPMARTELDLRPGIAAGVDRLERADLGPSTFRDNSGEIWTRSDSRTSLPKRHLLRAVLVVGGAVAIAVVAGVKYRHQTTRFLDGAAAQVAARRRPVGVRVNFLSDPEGATVTRSDGTVLGVTPMWKDLPVSHVPTVYVIGKTGYLSKTDSIVPEMPLSIFQVLRRDEPAPLVEMAAPPSPEEEPSLGSPGLALEQALPDPVRRRRTPNHRTPSLTTAAGALPPVGPEPVPVPVPPLAGRPRGDKGDEVLSPGDP